MSHKSNKNKTADKRDDSLPKVKGLFGQEHKNTTTGKIFSILVIGLLIWSFISIGLNVYSFIKLNEVKKLDSQLNSVVTNVSITQSDRFRSIEEICIGSKSLSNACFFLGAVKTSDIYFCGKIVDNDGGSLVKTFCYKKLASDHLVKGLSSEGISFAFPEQELSIKTGEIYRVIFPVKNNLDRTIRVKPVFESKFCDGKKLKESLISVEKQILRNSTMDFVVEINPDKFDSSCLGKDIYLMLAISDPANPKIYFSESNVTFVIKLSR